MSLTSKQIESIASRPPHPTAMSTVPGSQGVDTVGFDGVVILTKLERDLLCDTITHLLEDKAYLNRRLATTQARIKDLEAKVKKK